MKQELIAVLGNKDLNSKLFVIVVDIDMIIRYNIYIQFLMLII